MFDDQPIQNAGQVPSNLPLGEPEDMFGNTPDPEDNTVVETPSSIPPPAPSALGAGVLKPRLADVPPTLANSAAPEMQPNTSNMTQPLRSPSSVDGNTSGGSAADMPPKMVIPPPGMGANGDVSSIREPIGSKKTITIIIVVVLVVILGLGSAWIYFSFVRSGGTPTNEVDISSIDTNLTNTDPNTEDDTMLTEPVTEESNEQETTLATSSIDEQILFGEPVDTDGDGLDDVREAQVGTDAKNWDSDVDNLSDGDEVIIWKTDPLKKDTDGDGYDDGEEVKNGYNPSGTGKLFEPPTTTQQ